MKKRVYPYPCTKCGDILDEDGFYIKYKSTGGRFSECKSCWGKRGSIYKKSKREADPVGTRRRARESWGKSHPQSIQRGPRHVGKDMIRKRINDAIWRERHREQERLRGRRDFKRFPDRYYNAGIRRRGRKRGAEGSFSMKEWRDLCIFYNSTCLMCLRKDVKLSQDHVIPLSRGGNNTINNIQPLCRSCNNHKSTHILDLRPIWKMIDDTYSSL